MSRSQRVCSLETEHIFLFRDGELNSLSRQEASVMTRHVWRGALVKTNVRLRISFIYICKDLSI